MIARAQQAGALRPDIGVGDVVVLLLANAGVLEATREHAPQAWRRFAALMVDAMRAGTHEPLPPPTPAEGCAARSPCSPATPCASRPGTDRVRG